MFHSIKNRDQKILELKEKLPESLLQIRKLIEKILAEISNSKYKKNDLRKTFFEKVCTLFFDFGLHIELTLEEETLQGIIKRWREFKIGTRRIKINADYQENFLIYRMRNLYSESIELVEYLVASILESYTKRSGYVKFGFMLNLLEKEQVLESDDREFLKI